MMDRRFSGIMLPGGGSSGTIADEIPSGTINGANPTFVLANTPISDASVFVFLNGLRQSQGASYDYTISGGTITFTAGMIPQTGDSVHVNYTY